jgi:hypothetical protein
MDLWAFVTKQPPRPWRCPANLLLVGSQAIHIADKTRCGWAPQALGRQAEDASAASEEAHKLYAILISWRCEDLLRTNLPASLAEAVG